MATGSLVSHHGIGKYWHFVFYELSPICADRREKKRKKERKKTGEEKVGGVKSFSCVVGRQQIEGKRTPRFNNLIEKYLLANR